MPAPTSCHLFRTALLSLVCLGLGCARSETRRATGSQVRDSAGVTIVESATPAGGVFAEWTVPPEPVLQIGAVQGEDAYQFTQVWDAVQLPDGRIAVVEGSEFQIRVFDESGRHLHTFGGDGDGPNEFGGPPWLALTPPDTLVVWDPGHYRLSRFDTTGSLLRQESLVSTIGELSIIRFVNGNVWQTGPHGGLLWTGPGPREGGDGLRQSLGRFVLIDDAGRLTRDFGTHPSGQTISTRRSDGIAVGFPNVFAPTTAGALGPSPSRVALASLDAWEIRIFGSDGELNRILRAAIPRNPVTNQMVARERERLPDLAEGLGLTLRETEQAFDQLTIPDSLAPIASLRWDGEGNLWAGRRVGRIRDGREYVVFDPAGRWVTNVELPDAIGRILEIGENHILASWYDELGVAYLRMYRIHKPNR